MSSIIANGFFPITIHLNHFAVAENGVDIYYNLDLSEKQVCLEKRNEITTADYEHVVIQLQTVIKELVECKNWDYDATSEEDSEEEELKKKIEKRITMNLSQHLNWDAVLSIQNSSQKSPVANSQLSYKRAKTYNKLESKNDNKEYMHRQMR